MAQDTETARVWGVVKDSDGNAIEDAFIHLYNETTSYDTVVLHTETSYSITSVPYGLYTIEVTHQEYQREIIENVNVSMNPLRYDINLTEKAPENYTISGKIVSTDDAAINITGASLRLSSGNDFNITYSNGTGNFTIATAGGVLDVLIDAQNYWFKEFQITVNANLTGQTYTLDPIVKNRTFTGFVLDNESQPVSGVYVWLEDKTPSHYNDSDLLSILAYKRTGSNGDFTFSVYPAQYRFVVGEEIGSTSDGYQSKVFDIDLTLANDMFNSKQVTKTIPTETAVIDVDLSGGFIHMAVTINRTLGEDADTLEYGIERILHGNGQGDLILSDQEISDYEDLVEAGIITSGAYIDKLMFKAGGNEFILGTLTPKNASEYAYTLNATVGAMYNLYDVTETTPFEELKVTYSAATTISVAPAFRIHLDNLIPDGDVETTIFRITLPTGYSLVDWNDADSSTNGSLNLTENGVIITVDPIVNDTVSSFNLWIDVSNDEADPVALLETSDDNTTYPEDTYIQFLGNHSTDADPGMIASYLWEFGDGTTDSYLNPQHRFANPGVYKVNLTVTDYAGNSDTMSQNITINDTADPNPYVEDIKYEDYAKNTIPVGKEVMFNASQSFDNGGIETYSWSFSDSNEVLTGEYINYTFKEGGSQTVVLTVTDAFMNSKNKTLNIDVLAPNLYFPVDSIVIEDEDGNTVLPEDIKEGKKLVLIVEVGNNGSYMATNVSVNLTVQGKSYTFKKDNDTFQGVTIDHGKIKQFEFTITPSSGKKSFSAEIFFKANEGQVELYTTDNEADFGDVNVKAVDNVNWNFVVGAIVFAVFFVIVVFYMASRTGLIGGGNAPAAVSPGTNARERKKQTGSTSTKPGSTSTKSGSTSTKSGSTSTKSGETKSGGSKSGSGSKSGGKSGSKK